MYVCLCKAVSERRIREAAGHGACSVRDLRLRLGLGSQCGKCVPTARAVLDACAPADAANQAAREPNWAAQSF